jgi:hypothetical protein
VPIAISKKHLQQHTKAFTGVDVRNSAACDAYAGAAYRNASINALLFFCSEQPLQVALLQPVVHGVALVASAESFFSSTPALLAFGGNVNASIIGGKFTNNTAGAALVALQQAEVHIHNTKISSHTGRRARGVLALDAATVSISNSSFSSFTAPGAVLARNQSRLSITASTFVHNTLNAFNNEGGGLLQFEDSAAGTITSSTISSTTAGQASGLAVYNNTQVRATICLQYLRFNYNIHNKTLGELISCQRNRLRNQLMGH